LGRAIAQLEKCPAFAHSPAALADYGLPEQLRNSVIQCFEFTYELCRKILKLYLEEAEASPAAGLSRHGEVAGRAVMLCATWHTPI
jgi:hypothetical protein